MKETHRISSLEDTYSALKNEKWVILQKPLTNETISTFA
jgi:hypothetical protein